MAQSTRDMLGKMSDKDEAAIKDALSKLPLDTAKARQIQSLQEEDGRPITPTPGNSPDSSPEDSPTNRTRSDALNIVSTEKNTHESPRRNSPRRDIDGNLLLKKSPRSMDLSKDRPASPRGSDTRADLQRHDTIANGPRKKSGSISIYTAARRDSKESLDAANSASKPDSSLATTPPRKQ